METLLIILNKKMKNKIKKNLINFFFLMKRDVKLYLSNKNLKKKFFFILKILKIT